MNNSNDPRSTVLDLEGSLAVVRDRLVEVRAAVDRARERRTWTLELLQIDEAGAPLPLGPLLGAVGAAIGALTAALGAYAVCLGGEAIWGTLAVAGFVVGFVGLVVSRRPGAGGSARALLARVARVVGVLALLAIVVGTLVRR
jgi:hypothetical protein